MAELGLQLLWSNLGKIGFFEIILPLLLILAITYGILKKSEVLGDEKSINAVVSIAIAFLGVGGLLSIVDVSVLQGFFGFLGIVIMAVLGFLIIIALLGVDISKLGDKNSYIAGALLFAIIIVGAVFLYGYFGTGIEEEQVYNVLSVLIAIIFLGAMVWVITKD